VTPVDTVLAAHRACTRPATLLVDVDVDLGRALAKEKASPRSPSPGRSPKSCGHSPGWGRCAWWCSRRALSSGTIPGAELGGTLGRSGRLDPHPASVTALSSPDEMDATEDTFLDVYPEWRRHSLDDVVELRIPATAAIEGKRVISLAIFGEDESFWRALPTYIRATTRSFPATSFASTTTTRSTECPTATCYTASNAAGLSSLSTCPLPRSASDAVAHGSCWDPEVDFVFCRDIDALPTWRERCVAEIYRKWYTHR